MRKKFLRIYILLGLLVFGESGTVTAGRYSDKAEEILLALSKSWGCKWTTIKVPHEPNATFTTHPNVVGDLEGPLGRTTHYGPPVYRAHPSGAGETESELYCRRCGRRKPYLCSPPGVTFEGPKGRERKMVLCQGWQGPHCLSPEWSDKGGLEWLHSESRVIDIMDRFKVMMGQVSPDDLLMTIMRTTVKMGTSDDPWLVKFEHFWHAAQLLDLEDEPGHSGRTPQKVGAEGECGCTVQ